ncbi:hypothetical protein F183_A28350 [Bryobacterales bacterium F-183]|nr:hypothetical protein F183_A28350 [Bryobacterales bacterium F-183]
MKTTAGRLSRFATLALPNPRTLAGVRVDTALSRADCEQALALRGEVYQRKGLLSGDLRTCILPPAANTPGSAIFVARDGESVVGTIAFYMDSPAGLPIDEVHPEEVARIRAKYPRTAEVGGLAVTEAHRCVGITMMLYRAVFHWAIARKTDCMVACINPLSRRVYSRLLSFQILGECKAHPRYEGAPSIPIGLDLSIHRSLCQADAGELPLLQRFFRGM